MSISRENPSEEKDDSYATWGSRSKDEKIDFIMHRLNADKNAGLYLPNHTFTGHEKYGQDRTVPDKVQSYMEKSGSPLLRGLAFNFFNQSPILRSGDELKKYILAMDLLNASGQLNERRVTEIFELFYQNVMNPDDKHRRKEWYQWNQAMDESLSIVMKTFRGQGINPAVADNLLHHPRVFAPILKMIKKSGLNSPENVEKIVGLDFETLARLSYFIDLMKVSDTRIKKQQQLDTLIDYFSSLNETIRMGVFSIPHDLILFKKELLFQMAMPFVNYSAARSLSPLQEMFLQGHAGSALEVIRELVLEQNRILPHINPSWVAEKLFSGQSLADLFINIINHSCRGESTSAEVGLLEELLLMSQFRLDEKATPDIFIILNYLLSLKELDSNFKISDLSVEVKSLFLALVKSADTDTLRASLGSSVDESFYETQRTFKENGILSSDADIVRLLRPFGMEEDPYIGLDVKNEGDHPAGLTKEMFYNGSIGGKIREFHGGNSNMDEPTHLSPLR